MSEELNALQETAEQARAKANQLQAALTDASTDEEKAAATEAEQAAVDAESAFAEAAKKAADAAAQNGSGADASESRTAFVKGVRPGEQCICPDGRNGTVHKFDEGLVCIPNADQG